KRMVTNKDTPGAESFSDSINNQKHERLARASLQELLRFNDALDSEISKFKNGALENVPTDMQMMQYMQTSKTLFDEAMRAMRGANGEEGRLALIKFADSVQDLMGYIHKVRLH